jgi:hypothetical protein
MLPTAPWGHGGPDKLTRLSKTLGGLVMVLSVITFALPAARELLLLSLGR